MLVHHFEMWYHLLSPRVVQKYTKFANFTGLHFTHFTILYDQTFTKFRMLFSPVLIDYSNSRVCLIGNWSIDGPFVLTYLSSLRISLVIIAFNKPS